MAIAAYNGMRNGCWIANSMSSRSLMTGKVSTEESKNEIRNSPGAPSAPANATIFCFQPLNCACKSACLPHFDGSSDAEHATSEERLNGFDNHIVYAMQLVGLNHKRRQDIDHVSEGPQQNTSLDKKSVQLRPHRRQIPRVPGDQLDGTHRTDLSRVSHLVHPPQFRQPLRIDPRDRRNAVEYRFLLENPQARDSRGTSQRISRVRMPVIEGVRPVFGAKCRFQLIRAERGAHGHESAGQPFRQAHQIRLNIREIAREHLPAASESSEHLVRDQQNTVSRARFPHSLQELRRVHNHSAGTLQKRLHDDRCDSIGALRQQRLEWPHTLNMAA